MNNPPKLTEKEWFLMRICWQKGATTAKDIYMESLKKEKNTYQAVKKVLDTMVLKGYLNCEKFAHTNINLYTPVINEKETIHKHIEHCLMKMFNDDLFPLFAYLFNVRKVTTDEIEDLKRRIEEIDEE